MDKLYMTFKLNQNMLCMETKEVVGVLDVKDFIALDTKFIHVTRYEGKNLPVIDVEAAIGVYKHELCETSKIIVVKNEVANFGLLVKDVVEIGKVSDVHVKKPEPKTPRYIIGYLENVKILDPTSLITEEVHEKFENVRKLNVAIFEETMQFHQNQEITRTVLQQLHFETMNWIIQASQKDIDPELIEKAVSIHNQTLKL